MATPIEFTRAVVIVPHDTDPVLGNVRALYVGGTGHIALRPSNNTADVLISAIPAGTVLRVVPRFVRATGTTATLIVGLIP